MTLSSSYSTYKNKILHDFVYVSVSVLTSSLSHSSGNCLILTLNKKFEIQLAHGEASGHLSCLGFFKMLKAFPPWNVGEEAYGSNCRSYSLGNGWCWATSLPISLNSY